MPNRWTTETRELLRREVGTFLHEEGAAGRADDLTDQLLDRLATANLLVASADEQDQVAAVRERDELRGIFNQQCRRMRDATELWRAENPAERDLRSPDLGDLLAWLMDPARGRAAAAAALRDQDAVLAWWLRDGSATEDMALDWRTVEHLADYLEKPSP